MNTNNPTNTGREDNTPAQAFLGQVKATIRYTSKSIQENEYSKKSKASHLHSHFVFRRRLSLWCGSHRTFVSR
jgi:hypothetical protein